MTVRNIGAFVGTALAVASPAGLDAQDAMNGIASIATLSGQCEKLVVAGADLSAVCGDVVVNAAYRDDHSSFTFTTSAFVVTFGGPDAKAVGDRAVLKIARVVTTVTARKASPVPHAATGECVYTNPYAGPALVECNGVSDGQPFSARFRSDGKPPEVQRF